MGIGLRIKDLRRFNKITQMEFSSIIGVDNSQLSKIERGELSPTINQVLEICSKFNVSTDYLLIGKGSMILNQEERKKSMVSEPQESYQVPDVGKTIPDVDMEMLNRQLKDAHEEIGALKYQLKEAKKENELLKNSSKRVTR